MSGVQAQEVGEGGPSAGQAWASVAGGAAQGAMTGAMFGPWGAAIGGVIGAGTSLMDAGVRDAVGKSINEAGSGFMKAMKSLVDGIGGFAKNFLDWLIKGTESNFKKLIDGLGNAFKLVANGFISMLNQSLSAFQFLPRAIIGMVQKLPIDAIPGARDAINAAASVANFQIARIAYGGQGHYGPAMAREALMSGRRPLVVNDGEFVIPSNGFATLSNLVGQNLRNSGVINDTGRGQVSVSMTLVVNSNSVVADANELANTLREPVYQIINEAWQKVSQTIPLQRQQA
jgi:molybdopterin biosynthesis enzyme MoaB